MDSIFAALLSWQLLLFSLGVFFIVWFVRTIVEFLWAGATGNKIWEEIVLRFLPCVVGAVIGKYAALYPYPLGIVSASGRIMFGIVSGGISSLVFASLKGMARGYIQNMLNGLAPQNTICPPPCPPAPPILQVPGVVPPSPPTSVISEIPSTNTGIGMGITGNGIS